MNIKQSLSTFLLIVGVLLLAACSSTSSDLFQSDRGVRKSIFLESFNALETKLTTSDGFSLDTFGTSVSISGDTAVIGALDTDEFGDFSGSVYIFTRSGTSWIQQVKLATGLAKDFGRSVSISGDTAIVSFDSEETAYIFTRLGTSWTKQAELTANDAQPHIDFGYSVSISGDTAIVRAKGAAYIFIRSGTSWTQQAKLVVGDVRTLHHGLRDSVSISGDTAIVSDYDGYAYIFARSGTIWTQQAELRISDVTDPNGNSVAISGDTAIVGSPGDDDNGVTPGSAYIYKLTTEEPPDTEISTIYVSSSSSGSTGNISFRDEDILAFDINTNSWSLYFDGSDVGLAPSDLNAFHLESDGSILFSLEQNRFTIPGFATVRTQDIVRFIPTSLGNTTQGSFEWYFDGSDVGLGSTEGIDAISFTADGDLLISIIDNFSVSGAKGRDEDLLTFSAESLGRTTAGTWSFYADGSDVSLSRSSEDIHGVWVDPNNDDLYLTTHSRFSVRGLKGDKDDIFIFTPDTLGGNTSGSFSVFWDGDQNDFIDEGIDGMSLQ